MYSTLKRLEGMSPFLTHYPHEYTIILALDEMVYTIILYYILLSDILLYYILLYDRIGGQILIYIILLYHGLLYDRIGDGGMPARGVGLVDGYAGQPLEKSRSNFEALILHTPVK